MKRYFDVKNVVDLLDRDSVQKTMKKQDAMILKMFQKNPRLLLHSGQTALCKKVSCDTTRRRLQAHSVKFRRTVKKPLLSANYVEKRLAWAKENLDRD